MEELPEGIYLKFKPNTIQSVRKLYNLDEKRIVESVDLLSDWLKKQEHFRKKELPREYLERFVVSAKGSLEVAKTRLDKLFTARTLWPECFSVLDVNYFKKYNTTYVTAVLPELTDEWTRVNVIKIYPNQPLPSCLLAEYIQFMNIELSYIFKNEYASGLVTILDITDVNLLDLLSVLNTTLLSQMITLCLEGYGLSIKGIHLLTTSKLSDMLVSLLKQLLNKKVGERLHVHRDIDTVYEFVPKRILPADYGGECASLSQLYDAMSEEFSSKEFIEYLKEMNMASTDESRRPKNMYNDLYVNMPGSFRSLSVD